MRRWWSLSLLALLPACVSARWSVTAARPLAQVSVGPAHISGPCDLELVQNQRQALIDSLRQHGYDVVDAGPGASVPLLALTVEGRIVDDAQMHAPDDPRHHIYNDLHYQFVSYRVAVTVVDGAGTPLAQGSAEADRDPGPALRALAQKIFRDTPPGAHTNTPSAVAAR